MFASSFTLIPLLPWLWLPQILQTGQEIMELDTSGFATQGPTVYSGNIGENRYIVQVSPLGIRLLEGGECRNAPWLTCPVVPFWKFNNLVVEGGEWGRQIHALIWTAPQGWQELDN